MTFREPTTPRAPPLQQIVQTMVDVPRSIAAWRARRRASPAWTVAVVLVLALMLLPVATIAYLAIAPADNIWPHLAATVLPRALLQTALLTAGVALITLVVGTAAAWLVTMYRFPGRGLTDRLLVLPLAMPTYITAYCYVELMDVAGPLQTWLRAVFGWSSVRDYWFPDVRSLGGAVFVLSMALYPYVYLTARASFVQQSVCVLEVARTLGQTAVGTLWTVALPLARPALAAGVALALMECLNDLGAVQHLGVETLTVSIYTTWLQRSNLGGAAQLAVVMLAIVAMLLAGERMARGRRRFHHTTRRYRAIPFSDLEGWRGYAAAFVCLLPFLLGFLIPFSVLAEPAIRYGASAFEPAFLRAAGNSLLLAAIAALLAVSLALLLSYAARVAPNGLTRPALQAAGLGYAVPGTVLAVGLLFSLGTIDNAVDRFFRSTFGLSTGLLLSGTIAALVAAYTIRFLAVALGSVDAGLQRISPSLDAASRTLGLTSVATLWRVHLPLLAPALGAAGLLVFVDTVKELPSTLLLRPFNFDTLATQIYNFAALEQFEHTAPGALAIVLVGLIPVLLLHRTVSGRRPSGV
jgi:iron(III) transport system permease protein